MSKDIAQTKSASVSEEKAKRTSAFIKDVLEPKIGKMIEEANKILRKRGVQIGADVQWFIDKYELEGNENETEID